MALLCSSGINGQVKIALKEAVRFRITSQMLRSAKSLSMCHPSFGKKVVLSFLLQIISIFILEQISSILRWRDEENETLHIDL